MWHDQREKPNNLKLAQQTKTLIHNQLVDKAKAKLPTFSHSLHLATRHIYLTLSTIR
ncbi:unknown [Bacteroides sp. CAG:545]|nr:unknown [Bacteroides sp. CAG:545]